MREPIKRKAGVDPEFSAIRLFPFSGSCGKILIHKRLGVLCSGAEMKTTAQKIVFFLLSMLFLFVMYRCAMSMKESGSPYVSFPNKIETFK